MTAWILVLPILAAVLHAVWNALVKTAADRLVTLGFIAFMNFAIGLAFLPFVDPEAIGLLSEFERAVYA